MSISIRILVPEGTTNYVKNPTCRYDLTGYTTVGATGTRSFERARFGICSEKVVTSGASLYEGVYYRINWLLGIQGNMTGSVYLRGSGIVRLRLVDGKSGKSWTIPYFTLQDLRWKRYEVSGYCTGGNDVRLFVETDSRAQVATFYQNGMQVELKSQATTYCDGDQEGCTWNVLRGASISTRSPYTRAGGRWVSLAGCDRDEKNLYVTVAGGMGVAPIQNSIQPFSNAPGAFYQREKVSERVITFTFHAINSDLLRRKEKSLNALHELRRALFDIIKPDRTAGFEGFLVEYKDGETPLYIRLRYDGGMEGEWDIRNKFINSFPIRFVAVSPFFTDDNQEVSALDFQDSSIVNFVQQRVNGVWSEMNGGLSDNVREFAIGSKGELYACGDFVRANNKTTAIDPMIYANFVAYWDGSQWQKLGSGANGAVNRIAVAPNGDVYAIGAFILMDGVGVNHVAKWSIATRTWSALGSGLAGGTGVWSTIKVAPNGDVYVGGNFTMAGGVSCYNVARWDGSSWHSLGVYGGTNADVYAIAISSDGMSVYIGGLFTDEYTSPGILKMNYVAGYDPVSNQFYDLGDGFDAYVLRLRFSPGGRLYACGNFTSSGTNPVLYIAWWNGNSWRDMAGGANGIIRNMDIAADETVIAVGDFTRIGSTDTLYQALWNGATWVSLDTKLIGNGRAVIRDSYGNIYLASNWIRVEYSGITFVTNPGTSEAPVKFYIVGPATLYWIENQTSQVKIYANLVILSGEEITIDCAKGNISSSVRGSIPFSILPGSDLHSWKLLPGENKIAMLMTSDANAVAQIAFTPQHWSADSTSGREVL